MSIATSALKPSAAQVKYLTDLATEYSRLMRLTESYKNATDEIRAGYDEILNELVTAIPGYDRPTVSRKIDQMRQSVQSMRAKVRDVAPAVAELESGIYLADDDRIFKVYTGQSGRVLAKLLVVDVEGDAAEGIDGEAHFEYAGLASRFVKAEGKMSLEQAKAYGAIYGVCCQCGRTLTDEGSIADGIGPVCAGKF